MDDGGRGLNVALLPCCCQIDVDPKFSNSAKPGASYLNAYRFGLGFRKLDFQAWYRS